MYNVEIADNEPDPQRAKVRVDIRKWVASRLNRNKYGERLEVNHAHVLDITPVLEEAEKRLKSIDVEVLKNKVLNASIEAEDSDTETM
ncbi:MAG: hypothetical protein SCARUB_04392 [Candidatus Scalindua rubra]|uniref:Uncharacterized protein n=1 Tax=Candidatus Scalindua rubra TaxID=1872076 RepID=A0A1E3X4A7_9BACT|nr:MAG: hypothetical protein SCARUB_04392 [Candidatus Scalindua rubra]